MNIVAIGGGNKQPAIETALKASPTEQNLVTIVLTACSWSGSYNSKVPQVRQFFADFGLKTEILHEFGETPSKEKIADLLGRSSLIYTIGGNTPYMLRQFAVTGIGTALQNLLRTKPVIHAGVSAGALLPFELMHSNPSVHPSHENWDFTMLSGLGLVHGIATAHADSHDPTPYGALPYSRLDHLTSHFPGDHTLGLGIDNGAAVILGDTPSIIRADPDAQVHLLERSSSGTIDVSLIEDPESLGRFVA